MLSILFYLFEHYILFEQHINTQQAISSDEQQHDLPSTEGKARVCSDLSDLSILLKMIYHWLTTERYLADDIIEYQSTRILSSTEKAALANDAQALFYQMLDFKLITPTTAERVLTVCTNHTGPLINGTRLTYIVLLVLINAHQPIEIVSALATDLHNFSNTDRVTH